MTNKENENKERNRIKNAEERKIKQQMIVDYKETEGI